VKHPQKKVVRLGNEGPSAELSTNSSALLTEKEKGVDRYVHLVHVYNMFCRPSGR
jgi:hypothetical protein